MDFQNLLMVLFNQYFGIKRIYILQIYQPIATNKLAENYSSKMIQVPKFLALLHIKDKKF